jgi:transcriptional regulator with XRE-family HTH domain
MDFHLKIKELRTSLGLSQQKFADMAGSSRGVISQIELGNQNPTLDMIKSIAILFSIPYEYFFSDMSASVALNKQEISKPVEDVLEEAESPPGYKCPYCTEKDEQITYLKKLIAYLEKDIEEKYVESSGGQKRKAV